MTTQPLDVDDAIVRALKESVISLKTVDLHGPEFSEDELKQYLIQTPFALVIANDEEAISWTNGAAVLTTKEPHTILLGAKSIRSMPGAIRGAKDLIAEVKELLDGRAITVDGVTYGPFRYEGLQFEYTGVGLVTLTMKFVRFIN